MLNNPSRHFGKIAAICIYMLVVIAGFAGINLSNFRDMGAISIWFFLAFLIAFFAAVFLYYKKSPLVFSILFMVTIFISQAYIISSFYHQVELDNADESMYDQNASYGLAWIVAIPYGAIVTFLIGLVYDVVKNRAYQGPAR